MEKLNFKKIKKPYLIAEIGGNHNANLKSALEGIRNAKISGANCVKFQMYTASSLVLPNMKLMNHVKKISNEKSQYERFKRLELKEKDIKILHKKALKEKIHFAVTPFDISFVDFLNRYVTFFKVASGDLNYFPLLEKISKYKKPVILSTGMSNFKEIREAVKILKKNQVALLHCISAYPTNDSDLNLSTLVKLKKQFNSTIGLSDHTKDSTGAIMAISMGAKIIEKHFLPNSRIRKVGDFKLSLNPKEFSQFSKKILSAYKTVGIPRKEPFKNEMFFFNSLRRSIYFKQNMKKKSLIKISDITFLRPYNSKGLEIKDYKFAIGKKLSKNVNKFQLVRKKYLS